MKEDFILVGYSGLVKNKNHRIGWTSSFIKEILKHKLIFSMVLIIVFCICLNFWLIFRFVNLLQVCYVF